MLQKPAIEPERIDRRALYPRPHHGTVALVLSGTYAVFWHSNQVHLYNLATSFREYTCVFEDDNSNQLPVTAVCEASLHLLVALKYPDGTGMIHVLDIATSQLLRKIRIPSVVTSMVALSDDERLLHQLKQMCSQSGEWKFPVAIGTKDGRVLIADIICSESMEMDDAYKYESSPSLIVDLTEAYHNSDGTFSLEPNGPIIRAKSRAVTALEFFPDKNLLCAGYKFGAFQIWSTPYLRLVNVTHDDESYLKYPVTHFALQQLNERSALYLWVGRGSVNNLEKYKPKPVSISLYQLIKTNSGVLAGERKHSREFGTARSRTGRIIQCSALPTPLMMSAGVADSANHLSNNYAFIAWEIFDSFDEASQSPTVTVHATLFNLNRASALVFNDSDNSAYEPVHLNSVITSHGTQRLQAFRVDPLSIAQHTRVSLSQFAPDPARGADTRSVPAGRTSVSFDAIAIVDGQLFQLAFLSPQAKVLATMAAQGAYALQNPEAFLPDLLKASLLTNQDATSPAARSQVMFDVALFNNMASLICDFISEQTRGKSGNLSYLLVNPRIVLDWAWESRAKPLFDYVKSYYEILFSGRLPPPAERAAIYSRLTTIHALLQDLRHILVALHERSQEEDATPSSQESLRRKSEAIRLFITQLEIIIWLLDNNELLDVLADRQIFEKLKQEVARRRAARADAAQRSAIKVNAHMQGERPTNTTQRLLMIDNIFKQLMESSTDSAMEVGEEGPSVKALIPQCFPSPKGRYPPENMRELIGLFTTGDDDVLVDPIYRHQLLLYFLHDLAYIVPDMQPFIDTFVHQFMMPVETSQFILALWLLDARRFSEACSILTHPNIDLRMYAPAVLNILFDFGEHSLALRFYRAKHAELRTIEDGTVALRVLLANNLVSEALMLERKLSRTNLQCYDLNILENLLYFIFNDRVSKNDIPGLFNLPLDSLECTALEKYLRNLNDDRALDWLLVFRLQRARYVEAMDLYNEIQQRPTRDKADVYAAKFRADLLQNYRLVMPPIERPPPIATTPQLQVSSPLVSRPVQQPAPRPSVSAVASPFSALRREEKPQQSLPRLFGDSSLSQNIGISTASPSARAALQRSATRMSSVARNLMAPFAAASPAPPSATKPRKPEAETETEIDPAAGVFGAEEYMDTVEVEEETKEEVKQPVTVEVIESDEQKSEEEKKVVVIEERKYEIQMQEQKEESEEAVSREPMEEETDSHVPVASAVSSSSSSESEEEESEILRRPTVSKEQEYKEPEKEESEQKEEPRELASREPMEEETDTQPPGDSSSSSESDEEEEEPLARRATRSRTRSAPFTRRRTTQTTESEADEESVTSQDSRTVVPRRSSRLRKLSAAAPETPVQPTVSTSSSRRKSTRSTAKRSSTRGRSSTAGDETPRSTASSFVSQLSDVPEDEEDEASSVSSRSTRSSRANHPMSLRVRKSKK